MALPNPKFDASFQRIFGSGIALGEHADAFFERFYEHFLGQPDIVPLFADTDMKKQVQMLKGSLMHTITYTVLDRPSAELERLASLHRDIGLPSQSFDHWLAALVATVEDFDPEFDESTALAWQLAVVPALTYMRLEAS